MIKLIAIDLDGTLFDNKKNISNDNLRAIKMAKEMGCHIVIATGRPTAGVYDVLKKLELTTSDDYCIAYNGAKIFNVGTGIDIYNSSISGRDVKKIYKEAIKMGFHFHAFKENEELLTMDHNPYTDIEATINHVDDHLYNFSTANDDDKFLKAMIVDSKENIDYCIKKLDESFYKDYIVVRSSDIFLEFLNPKTSKGEALKYIAKYLNIDLSETMALGDAGNDLPMLLAAGIGVCMENSFSDIKTKVKHQTASNENSGVARAIEKYVLNK